MDKKKKDLLITSIPIIFIFIILGYVYIIGLLSQLSSILFKEIFIIITLTTIGTGFIGFQIQNGSPYFKLRNRFFDISILMLISLLSGLFYINFEKGIIFGYVSLATSIVGLIYLLIIFLIARFLSNN